MKQIKGTARGQTFFKKKKNPESSEINGHMYSTGTAIKVKHEIIPD